MGGPTAPAHPDPELTARERALRLNAGGAPRTVPEGGRMTPSGKGMRQPVAERAGANAAAPPTVIDTSQVRTEPPRALSAPPTVVDVTQVRTEPPRARSAPPPPTELVRTPFSAPQDPLIGKVLGDYRVDARLGEGGMGLVYRGVHTVIGRRAAIKVLRAELAEDQDYQRRFENEAKVVSAIRHPRVVDVFAYGRTETGAPYFVMELLDGESLETRLKRGPLALEDALNIFEQICEALEAAHAASVTHRDLKPTNIFLSSFSERIWVKVLDFGISRFHDAPPGRSAVMAIGTPGFMAPEQARADPTSPATDLYALGSVMYWVLTGKATFDDPDDQRLMERLVSEKPPTPLQLGANIPVDLNRLVMRLLERDPARRPTSALAVRRELQHIGRSLPPSAPPADTHAPTLIQSGELPASRPAAPAPSGTRRSGAWRWAAGALAAAALVAVALLLMRHT